MNNRQLLLAALLAFATQQANAAKVHILSKSFEPGSVTLNYDQDECGASVWQGGQNLSGHWYEYGATFSATLIANTVPGPFPTPYAYSVYFDQRAYVTYSVRWIPQTRAEQIAGPSQDEVSYWEFEIASQGQSLASAGYYELSPPMEFIQVENVLMASVIPSTQGGLNLEALDTVVDHWSTQPNGSVLDVGGSSNLIPSFQNFQGNPVYVYAGDANPGDSVSWTFDGNYWVGEATIELTHSGLATGFRSHLIDGSACESLAGHRLKLRLKKVGSYLVSQ